jgi:translation initiation factor IF-2
VLKSDTAGTLEALSAALGGIEHSTAEVRIIERGIGDVAKSDLLMATTGSRLILGFQVGVRPKVEELSREHGVEVRLYSVIYHLVREVEEIAANLRSKPPEEEGIGRARVIALFKTSRRGVILGCDVVEGRLAKGKPFRVIAAPGPVYEGVIQSLHIEQAAVAEARVGQKVGLKVEDFKGAQVGDWVECFDPPRAARSERWTPRPGVHRVES